MDKLDFYQLLDSWTQTPEYQEYENLCFECDTLIKQIENGREIMAAFTKAINTNVGRKLANEPMFLDFLRSNGWN